MSDLAEIDRRIVDGTLTDLSAAQLVEVARIHERMISDALARRDRLLRELESVERAIAMREHALGVIQGRYA